MRKQILNRIILTFTIIILIAVICVCTYQITYKILDYRISEKKFDRIAEKYVSLETDGAETDVLNAETEDTPKPVKAEEALNLGSDTAADTDAVRLTEKFPITVDFGSLKEENSDVIGWIYLAESKINYPVVKCKDNDYYLHRSLDKEYSYGGTLFLDASCKKDWSGKNSIIHGHNMNDGSMFACLMNYKQQEYCDGNPYMYLTTPEGNYRLDVLAGFVTDPEAEVYTAVFISDDSFTAWYEKLLEKSMITTDVHPSPKSRIVTLSTCTYERNDARFVMMLLMRPVMN